MAESIAKDFQGQADWVYVGRGKAEHTMPEARKADTLRNEYMQRVFDIAAPLAVSELSEASATHGILADATAQEIIPESLQQNMSDKPTFTKKWLEWEKKASTPEHQNRMGKLLTSAAYMAGSFGLDFASDILLNETVLKKSSLRLPLGKSLSLRPGSGNKEMLKAGWEFITDSGIEKVTDWSVRKLTNREDVGFVSPMSRTVGKLGNTIINVFGDLSKFSTKTALLNSFVNPGFIEGAFRFAGAIPGGGFVKDFYAWANRQIMKGEGVLPYGADLAYNMLIAKMINQSKPVEALGKRQARPHTGGGPQRR